MLTNFHGVYLDLVKISMVTIAPRREHVIDIIVDGCPVNVCIPGSKEDAEKAFLKLVTLIQDVTQEE